MYFGSVKFFKHLIYTVFFLIIGAIVLVALWFGLGYFNLLPDFIPPPAIVLKWQEKALEKDIPTEPEVPLAEIMEELHAQGYTADSVLDAALIDDPEAVRDFVVSYIKSEPDTAKLLIDAGIEDMEIFTPDGGEISITAPEEPPAVDELIDPEESAPAYQKLYPDLYADPPTEFVIDTGAAYLTFDDGPTEHTESILYILEDYGVKATFFFSGGESEEAKRIMKRAADEGHTIGIHSLSHNYTEVYSSVESFLEDFNNTYQNVYEATGVKPQIFRFPGGSVNNYNRFVYKEIIAEMTRRGFVYYDWNVSGSDAVDGATWTTIYNNVRDGAKAHVNDRAIILLHDSKSRTVTVVEDVIDALRDMGYHFEALTHDIMPITFAYVS
ncbi:MAG: polysaccharide deacetylase [Ruminococcus sp.]|jgi:peptidoglycan/xylan/chitin deacetylase (PgdA/CDA1 family)|nr:polysaccharide deacetylase [Ruminococcus sp.]